MDPLTILAFVAILLVTLAFVGEPLLSPALVAEGPTSKERRRVELSEEKDRLIGAVRDLEHDRNTGKMEDGDFQALSARLKVDAAHVLKEIDVNEGRRVLRSGEAPLPSTGATDPSFSAPIVPSGSASAPGARFCTKCGRAARAEDGFCGKCGTQLP